MQIEFMILRILEVIVATLHVIVKIIYVILGRKPFPKPGPVTLGSKREDENGMFTCDLSFPEKTKDDVTTQELTYSIDGGAPVVKSYPIEVRVSDEFTADDNQVIAGSYVQIDDNGNRSEQSDFSFVIVDDIAPPKPGEVGLNKREV